MSQTHLDVAKTIEHYIFLTSDLIGKGFSSSVFKGTDQNDQSSVAVKVIDFKGLKQTMMETLLQSQINILTHISHPNVLSSKDIFITINNCYIITELCKDGDLCSILKKKGRFRGVEALKLMLDIINGYIYLQQNKILHRDLKPANILMHNGKARLADFGFACFEDDKNCGKYNVGTPLYMSPQTLFFNKYTKCSDTWSLGVIFYEILQGRTLWDVRSEDQLKNILKAEKEIIFRIAIREELETMIKRCLAYKAQERLETLEIRQILLKLIKQMEEEDRSAYRGSLTRRPSNILGQRKTSNSTIETLQRCKTTKLRVISQNGVLNRQLERKKTKQIQERIIRGKQNITLVHSTNQPKSTKDIEETSRYNHRLLKAGINLGRYMYKLLPKVNDLYCTQTHRQKLNQQIMGILLYLINILEQCMKNKDVGCGLGIKQYEYFSRTICFSKVGKVIDEYGNRYRKYAQQLSPINDLSSYSILDSSGPLTNLKSLIMEIELDSKTSEKHNTCIDYLVSLLVLLSLFRSKELEGLSEEGHLDQIIDNSPVMLGPQHLEELIKKRNIVCNNN